MSLHETVKIADAEAELLLRAATRVAELERHLGALRVEYMTAEARLVSNLDKAYREHDMLLQAIAKQHVADKPGHWAYDPNEKALVNSSS